jgi:hypothetical protein
MIYRQPIQARRARPEEHAEGTAQSRRSDSRWLRDAELSFAGMPSRVKSASRSLRVGTRVRPLYAHPPLTRVARRPHSSDVQLVSVAQHSRHSCASFAQHSCLGSVAQDRSQGRSWKEHASKLRSQTGSWHLRLRLFEASPTHYSSVEVGKRRDQCLWAAKRARLVCS